MAVELVLGNKIALFPGYGYEHGWCFMDGFELSIHARISFQQHPTKQQHLPVSQCSILDGRLLSRTGEPIGISRIGIGVVNFAAAGNIGGLGLDRSRREGEVTDAIFPSASAEPHLLIGVLVQRRWSNSLVE